MSELDWLEKRVLIDRLSDFVSPPLEKLFVNRDAKVDSTKWRGFQLLSTKGMSSARNT